MIDALLENVVKQSPSARLHQENELVAVDINNAFASARIFLQGAQLTRFQPKDNPDVIWCSPTAEYRVGQAIRGGIPICWPWFGALDKNPLAIQQQLSDLHSAPAHGFARLAMWQLDHIEDLATHTEVTFSYHHCADHLWPFNCELTIRFDVGRELQMHFMVSNKDTNSFHFSHALHSYFPCESVHLVEVTGLEEAFYIDALDDWNRKQQSGPVQFRREVDRIYLDTAEQLTIQHASEKYSIVVDSNDYACAVVWNPWADKSKRLSGFPDDAYHGMLCVESANVLQYAQSLGPGESQSYALTLRLVDA